MDEFILLAKFSPKILDNIRKEMVPFIGKILELNISFFQDEGVYANQQVYVSTLKSEVPGFWIPEEDLIFLKRRYEDGLLG